MRDCQPRKSHNVHRWYARRVSPVARIVLVCRNDDAVSSFASFVVFRFRKSSTLANPIARGICLLNVSSVGVH